MTNIIILVHGTWGRDNNGWYQLLDNSECFTFKLKDSLDGELMNPIYIPFEWSGDNNHIERELAAEKLACKLIELRDEHSDARFHFIAHSHGGNVVLKAVELYVNKLRNYLIRPFLSKENSFEFTDSIIEYLNSNKNKDILIENEDFNKIVGDIVKLNDEQKRNSNNFFYKLNMRVTYSYIFSSDGTIFYLAESLKGKIFDALEYLGTYEEHHRLMNIITLGTPYYYKKWDLSKLSLVLDRVIHNLVMFLALIITVMFFTVPIKLIFSTSWDILNPQGWHWLIQIAVGAYSIFFIYVANLMYTDRVEDTNVYFSPSNVSGFLSKLNNNSLCKSLIIHSEYFDEVYLGLSFYSTIKSTLNNKLSELSKTMWWIFHWERQRTGVVRGSISGEARWFQGNQNKFFFSIIMMPFFPVRFAINKLINWQLISKVNLGIKTLSFGLPEGEFSDSSVTVNNIPKLKFLNTYELDISNHIKDLEKGIEKTKTADTARNKIIQKKDEYSFLENEVELTECYEKSNIAKHILTEVTSDEKKRILMLEQRGKEILGVTGLRHSMYYKNDKVINAISQFLKGKFTSEAIPVNDPVK